MLKSLTVWNFALLEHVQVEFQSGLNILTGETGAGKSILIDSLGAVLGARMSADMVRSGCDWLRVEAVFSLEDESLGLHELLTQQAIDDSDKELIITRQLTRAGAGRDQRGRPRLPPPGRRAADRLYRRCGLA